MNEITINDTDNYISIMNHIITIDDMIDNLYYRTDIAWTKNVKCVNLLYLNNLKENDKAQLNNIIVNKLQEEVKKRDINKPIFKYIEYDICDKYNLYSIGYKKSSRTENHIIPIKIFKTPDNNINEIIENLEPFYSTLKYKIKEEKITRNIRNDFNDFKKCQYQNIIKLTNDIRDIRKNIKIRDYNNIDRIYTINEKYYNYYRNEIKNIKNTIYYISIGLLVNFAILSFLL